MKILVIFETTNRFFFKFCITLQCHETWLSVFFWLKFYTLSTKGAYQSTILVTFHVNSRKSEILHFDGLLLSKSYKISAKRKQKRYLSWRWRVMQSFKKNWLVVSSMTWRIWLMFTQKSLRWAFFDHSI